MTDTLSTTSLRTIDGGEARLADWSGKVLLVVNVASKCGLTPQYTALEALHRRFADRGFAVLGFPANDFAGQEPGTDAEIVDFCQTSYDVSFPMFSKIKVTGADKHPLYAELTSALPHATAGSGQSMRDRLKGYGMTPTDEPEVLWNFEKVLIGRDGEVAARFSPEIAPDDPLIVDAIENALAR